MTEQMSFNILTILPLILEMAVLTFAALIDPHIQRRSRKTMLIIVGLNAVHLVQSLLSYDLGFRSGVVLMRRIISVLGYSLSPVLILLLCLLVDDRKSHRFFWILIVVNALVHLATFFSNICFTITEDNYFQRGPLGYTCHITSGVRLIYLLILTLRRYKDIPLKEKVILLCNVLIVVASVVLAAIRRPP